MEIVDDLFIRLKETAPECFFYPKYPYFFRFDLILEGVNYGEIEVIVKDDLDISELKGDAETLKKLDEINKKREGERWKLSPICWERINYPLKTVNTLAALLGGNDFCMYIGREEDFKPNKGFNEMLDFVRKSYFPVNAEKLYKKTGICWIM